MTEPTTKAGRWLLDRARWDDGMRGFFVRINATGSPDDMHRHILAIEAEARADVQDACQAAGLPRDAALHVLLDAMEKRGAALALPPDLATLRDRVLAMPKAIVHPHPDADGIVMVDRAAALAIIAAWEND